MKLNILTLAALLMAGVAFTACSSEEDMLNKQPVSKAEKQVYTMTIQATKGDAQTRALSLDGNTLGVKWNEGEVVYVYQRKNGTNQYEKAGVLTAKASDNATTTLTGTLDNLGSSDDYDFLEFVLNCDDKGKVDYSKQTGVLLKTQGDNSIEENYDVAFEDLYCKYYTIDTETKTVSIEGGIILKSEQAIVKFSLVNADEKASINATKLTISTDKHFGKDWDYTGQQGGVTNKLELTPAAATNEIYVAFRGLKEDTSFTLTATDGDGNVYTCGPKVATFKNGKYYVITVNMSKKPYDINSIDATYTDYGGAINGTW